MLVTSQQGSRPTPGPRRGTPSGWEPRTSTAERAAGPRLWRIWSERRTCLASARRAGHSGADLQRLAAHESGADALQHDELETRHHLVRRLLASAVALGLPRGQVAGVVRAPGPSSHCVPTHAATVEGGADRLVIAGRVILPT